MLEQLYSPLVVLTTPEHAELAALARGCITRQHSQHYLGFAASQWRGFEAERPRRVKPLLYVYRVLLTGIHLMRTGLVEADLTQLILAVQLRQVDDLIARKFAGPEQSTLDEADIAVLQNLPLDAEASNVFGSCFTAGSCTGATRPPPALPTPQAFRLSEELPASLLRVMARLRPRVRGALGFRASWSESRNGHAGSLPGNHRERKRFGIRTLPFMRANTHVCAVAWRRRPRSATCPSAQAIDKQSMIFWRACAWRQHYTDEPWQLAVVASAQRRPRAWRL
jgi:hypothetical protein